MDELPDPGRWRRARDVFDAVASLAPAERTARLDALCADAPDVRREVEELLAHLSASDASLASVVGEAARAATDDRTQLSGGQALLHYGLVARIGEGSMGTVWRAVDHTLGRDVAIKVLPAHVADDPARVARFEQEAKLLASLNHPNVAGIYSVHHVDRVRFLAMELVDGDDLTRPIAQGPLPPDRVVSIATQMAAGLEAAHAKGIVHRDLKPANVKIRRDGTVKVLDFGLAKAVAGDGGVATRSGDDGVGPPSPAVTRVGAVLGTAAYMPPEQARGFPVDTRADIWAFGVIVFEMLAGHRPFAGATMTDVLAAVVAAEPDWTLLPPTTPAPLVRLIRRCLEKDTRQRLRDIGDARRELEQLLGAPGLRGRTRGWRPDRPSRRRWVLAAAAVALAAVAIGAWRWWPTPAAPPASERPLVAVRTFRNLSPDATQAFFAAGMSEEISGQLSQLSGLRLLSGDAAARYAEGDSRRMATELGVSSVVDGSVRVAGNRVRITVQLTDASSQQTLWSDTYDRDLADVFAVQSDVALQVTGALRAALTPDERQRVEQRATPNLEAYQLYLRWRQTPARNREEWSANLGLLRQAIALDPTFVTAQAALAYGQIFWSWYYDDGAALLAAGMAEAEAVLARDPTVALAHSALATGYGSKGVASRARLSFQRALALDPNDNLAMNNWSLMETYFGRFVESLEVSRQAFERSARLGNDYYHLSAPLIGLRDDAISWRWLTDGERRAPNHPRVQQQLALLEALGGRGRDALARMARLAQRYPTSIEVTQTRAELAFLVDAPDQEALVEPLVNASGGITGFWLAETPRVRYAHALARRGDATRARAFIDEAERAVTARIEGGDETPLWRVELAAIQILKKDHAASLVTLARAYDAGYREYGYLERDPIFAPLRGDERFKGLVDRMRRDIETQRQTARERGLLDIDPLLSRPQ